MVFGWSTMELHTRIHQQGQKQTLRHSLQTSHVAFPAFPTNLVAFRDGYHCLLQRGFLSLLLELAQIEVVPSVGFALPSCPWLSHPREAEEFSDLSWIIRWK